LKKYEGIARQLEMKRAELERRLRKIETHIRTQYDQNLQEQALELENDEVVNALAEETRLELEQIHSALVRIERNEYGICAICGETIPIGRLEALPYTDRCVACADE